MGPYNPLDQQLEYDKNTGEVTKWHVQPYNKVDEIANIIHWVVPKKVPIISWGAHEDGAEKRRFFQHELTWCYALTFVKS